MSRAQTVTREELQCLLQAVRTRRHVAGARYRHTRRDALLIELVAYTGLRPAHAVMVRVRDLPAGHEGATLKVGTSFVPVTPALFRRLWAYVTDRELLYESRLFEISARAARKMFRMYADSAGLAPIHTLDSVRTYGAAREWSRSLDLGRVAQRLGGASLITAARFVSGLASQA